MVPVPEMGLVEFFPEKRVQLGALDGGKEILGCGQEAQVLEEIQEHVLHKLKLLKIVLLLEHHLVGIGDEVGVSADDALFVVAQPPQGFNGLQQLLAVSQGCYPEVVLEFLGRKFGQVVHTQVVFFKAVGDLFGAWKRLLAAGLVYQVIAFVVLTPLAGLMLKLLMMTGDTAVLADQDILYFVLSPAGLIALVLLGTVGVAILALDRPA